MPTAAPVFIAELLDLTETNDVVDDEVVSFAT